MPDQLVEALIDSFPQLVIGVVLLLGLWIGIREFQKLRHEQRSEIDSAIKAHIGELVGDLQLQHANIASLGRDVEKSMREAERKIDEREAELADRMDHAASQLDHLDARLNEFEARLPRAPADLDPPPERLVVRASQAEDWPTAAAAINALFGDPDTTAAQLEAAGDAARNHGRNRRALELYERSCELAPERDSALLELHCLRAETSSDRRDESIRAAQRLVVDMPASIRLKRFANAMIATGRFDVLKETCLALLEKRDGLPSEVVVQALRDLAVAEGHVGSYDEADRRYRQALALDDGNEATLRAFYGHLRRRHDFEEALEAAERLVELDPLDPLYYVNCAEAAEGLKRYDEASRWRELGLSVATPDSMHEFLLRKARDKAAARSRVWSAKEEMASGADLRIESEATTGPGPSA